MGESFFLSHLKDLRGCVLRSLFFIILGFAVSWAFSEFIFDIVRRPITPYLKTASQGLIFLSPVEKFFSHIQVSFLSGLIISSPLWLYQAWKFVAPGLYRKERFYGLFFVICGSLLFVAGTCFVYFIVFPLAFNFLFHFGGNQDVAMISIREYISFFTTISFAFGFVFQLPLILLFLSFLNLVTGQSLAKYRRHAIVIMAVLCAIITPPDVVSMLLMMVPLLLLYELSVFLIKISSRESSTQK